MVFILTGDVANFGQRLLNASPDLELQMREQPCLFRHQWCWLRGTFFLRALVTGYN